ncbi:MAG: hypothetical protein K6G08_01655 [Prevotella sp.]|nr:hypothetical protein [Prevotella sp.]
MEIICRVKDQGACQEREYTAQNGNKETFASMPFLLESGGDTMYAEMIQEQARKQGQLSKDYYYKVQLQLAARPWQDQQGSTRYENRITITKIAVL